MSLLPLLALAPIMIATAVSDLRYLRIPNLYVMAGLALFIALLPTGVGDLQWRLLAALCVFASLSALFAVRLVGGGDVKMMTVVVLFVPPDSWSLFAVLISAALISGVIAILLLRSLLTGVVPTGWQAIDEPRAFPMGLAMAFAVIALPIVLLSS